MPYKRVGKTVYVKRDGWKSVGTSKTTKKAKSHLRLLQGVMHGWRPTGGK
jgi:hypothetical protein